MSKPKKYDFSGWATKNDLKCSDGRVIRKDAFKDLDGARVPLVWEHQHDSYENILGHADLENRAEGVYAYCTFNDNEAGRDVREIVRHGDITQLSIYANKLKQVGGDVVHGIIREVSLVLAGANPGARIDTVFALEHAEGEEDTQEGIIFTPELIELYHSDKEEESEKKEKDPVNKKTEANPKAEELEHADSETKTGKTATEIFETLNPEQKTLFYAMAGAIGDNSEGDDEAAHSDKDEEDEPQMKHNVFDNEPETKKNVLAHSDQVKIVAAAKSNSIGTLKAAMEMYMDENELSHADSTDLGIANISTLFPEYQDVRPGAPEMLTTDQGWIGNVLASVHKSPISRIRTRQADVRDITNLRAKGYTKGLEKTYVGNISLVNRTTDPQTIYVKSHLDRDDIIDIVDFDVVAYMYNIDRMNLNEELATAIMLGDGREDGAEGKISAEHIRPVWLDDELYTLHADVDIDAMRTTLQGTNTSAYFGDNYVYAEAIIQTLLYKREKYKGSGMPDFYCTPHLLNVMLLARDLNGRRIYDNVNELKAALNVSNIITVEQFEGKTRTTTDNKIKKLLGIMYNFSDYYLGATKGGEITHFTDFDIDFNRQKSLLETRVSGANTRVLSAIALEEDISA